MSPAPGVSYSVTVYETSPKSMQKDSWTDNGAPPNGGDCVALTNLMTDLGNVTFVVQAVIGSATAQVTLHVYVYGIM
jgi:hypothetical protein